VSESKLPEGLLDIYKQSAEMADRLSARRAVASSYFLTVQTGLLALLAFVSKEKWQIALAGVVLALTWWFLLRSYRMLNRAKFEVINEIEAQLPAAPFKREWEILGVEEVPKRKLEDRYTTLGQIEQVVPLLFLAINLGVLGRAVF
jgi:hypothetical protein